MKGGIVIAASDQNDPKEVGGKAHSLSLLQKGGFNVPDFVVIRAMPENNDLEPSEALKRELFAATAHLFEGGATVAVRSSAIDEDGAQNSFAGQLDSFLGVRRDDLVEKVALVWQSAFHARCRQYRECHGLEKSDCTPAVIIQRMIDAEAAGVAFSADPLTGDRNLAVVAATFGLGSALVSGETDADHFAVDRAGQIVQEHICCKTIVDKLDAHGELIVESTELNEASIARSIAVKIAEISRQVEDFFGSPQDIEWALKNAQVFLLQARPITTAASAKTAITEASGDEFAHITDSQAAVLYPPQYSTVNPPVQEQTGDLAIWDSSNIGESYQGVTTPLTFSFARKAYENVYIQFCKMMGVSNRSIARNKQIFPRMLGLVKGRIYYNLINWYRLLAMLPGYNVNQRFMEQMMGVKEPLPPHIVAAVKGRAGLVQDNTRSAATDAIDELDRMLDGVDFICSAIKIAHSFHTLDKQIESFNARFEEALLSVPSNADSLPLNELVYVYRGLEDKLLTKWDAPLSNDFFAMIFYGLLRTLTAKWCADSDGTLQNGLLCGEGGIISTEPTVLMSELAVIAASQPDFAETLLRGEPQAALAGASRDFIEAYEHYLTRFGDRCIEELKLESATLQEEPAPLLRGIGQLAKALKSEQKAAPAEQTGTAAATMRLAAESRVEEMLKGHPLRSALFAFVLKHARARVRERENLRFQRTRLFGQVRRLFTAIGKQFQSLGLINGKNDIFYLEVDEIFAFIEGATAGTNLRAIVEIRRQEFERYRLEDAPPDRITTFGIPSLARLERPSLAATDVINTQLKGIGCCPGIVRGPVRVVTDPRTAKPLDGEILVARRTDPGWIIVFPQATGILVEHGSVLSHSAIVARELGIPAIVSVSGLTAWLSDGDWVEFDGTTGIIRRVPTPVEKTVLPLKKETSPVHYIKCTDAPLTHLP